MEEAEAAAKKNWRGGVGGEEEELRREQVGEEELKRAISEKE